MPDTLAMMADYGQVREERLAEIHDKLSLKIAPPSSSGRKRNSLTSPSSTSVATLPGCKGNVEGGQVVRKQAARTPTRAATQARPVYGRHEDAACSLGHGIGTALVKTQKSYTNSKMNNAHPLDA